MRGILTVAAALMLAGPAVSDVVQLDSEAGTIDTVRPTAAVSLDDATPTSLNVVHFNVRFSESVGASFDASTVTLTGNLTGTATVSGSDPNYTVAVTLATPNNGGMTGISVGNGVTDLKGNSCVAAASPQYQILPTTKVPVTGAAGLCALFSLLTLGAVRRLRTRQSVVE